MDDSINEYDSDNLLQAQENFVKALSKTTGVKTEILTGTHTAAERLTLVLEDGRKLTIQCGDTLDHFFISCM